MNARIEVQACGCIALPDEVSKLLAIGAGSVLDITVEQESRLVLTRISAPLPVTEMSPKAACPLP